MSKRLTEDTVKYMIKRLINNANYTKKDYIGRSKDDFAKGKLLAYYEMLDTLKSELEISEQDLEDYGLEINLEDLL